MNKLGKTGILLIIAFLVTASAFGVYAFFFAATKSKAESATSIADTTGSVESRQAKLALTLATLKEQSDNIQKLDELFIKQKEIVNFTKRIESLGVTPGTKISIEGLTPSLSKDNAPILSFDIKVQGKFVDVMRTLELLENFPAKIEWSSVNIKRESEGSVAAVMTNGNVPQVVEPIWKMSVAGAALNFVRE